MSDSHRRDRGALVALGLALTAIVLVASLNQPIKQSATSPQSAYVEQSQNDDVSRIVAAIREFNPWDDSYAQWLMAIFGVAATLISYKAVVLVRDTLDLNRRATVAAENAVKETRRIGEAQVRAYLSVIDGHFQIWGDVLFLDVRVRNSGQSPSRHGSVEWALKYTEFLPSTGNLAKVEREVLLGPTPLGPVTADSDKGAAIDRFSEENGITPWFFERSLSSFYVRCTLYWEDIFDIKCEESFLLRGERDHGYVAARDGPDVIGTLATVAERKIGA